MEVLSNEAIALKAKLDYLVSNKRPVIIQVKDMEPTIGLSPDQYKNIFGRLIIADDGTYGIIQPGEKSYQAIKKSALQNIKEYTSDNKGGKRKSRRNRKSKKSTKKSRKTNRRRRH